MFQVTQIGCVNADLVAEYALETLLVVSPTVAKFREAGWTYFPCYGSQKLYRAIDVNGDPAYLIVAMTEDNLQGITVYESKTEEIEQIVP